jgi:geranylgeranyl pyrophosphate synthase
LLFTQALGGSIEDALPFSVAIEFIHAGALVHDDFFDMHEVRRGKVPLYRILDPRRAFLIADMLLSIAQAKLAESRNGYKALAKAIYEACRGACLEPLNPVDFLRSVRKRKIPEEFYIRLIRLKTAELFGTACKFGGIASNASPEFTRRAYEYGIQIGLAYQMADDLVDYMIACKTGEIDVPKMVKLLPALFYFAPSILTELATKIIKGKVGFVDCLRKMEIRDKCEQEIRGCLEQAKEKIDPFPGSTYKELLLEAPDFLIEKILEEIRAIEA